jgi:hypothetical protein
MRQLTPVAEQVWIRAKKGGMINVITPNSPECEVSWYWHVAPIATISSPSGKLQFVIDPSLFPNGPISLGDWQAKQGNATTTISITSARIFIYSAGGQPLFDDNYAKTAMVLQDYRDALELRSSHIAGPPPYNHCDLPGVSETATASP